MAFHDISLHKQFEIIQANGLEETISDFERHVKDTHTPESFPGIVLGKPDDPEEQFIVLTDFSVDIQRREGKSKVPCSICCPNAGKFFRIGYLIYHIISKQLRIVGKTCCGTELAGWDEELAKLTQRQRELAKRAFVRNNADIAVQLRERIHELAEISDIYKKFRGAFSRDFKELKSQLEDRANADPPTLVVSVPFQRVEYNRKTGERMLVADQKEEKVATLYGPTFIAREFSPSKKLNKARRIMSDYCPAEALEKLQEPIDKVIADYIKQWGNAYRLCREARNELDDARRFFTDHNFEGLREWGRHEYAPIRFKPFILSKTYLFKSHDERHRVELGRQELESRTLPDNPPQLIR